MRTTILNIETMVLLTTDEAAKLIRVSPRTMERWRGEKNGPPYIKLGRGKRARVFYELNALRVWMMQQQKTPPEDPSSVGESEVGLLPC